MSAEEVRGTSDRLYAAHNRFLAGDITDLADACFHADDVSEIHFLRGRVALRHERP